MKDNDANIARHYAQQGSLISRFVRWLTAWAWKQQIKAPFFAAHERGIIDSYALHEMNAFTEKMLEPEPEWQGGPEYL